MADLAFAKVGHFKGAAELRKHLLGLGVEIPLDDRVISAEEGSPLASPVSVGDFVVGNRWCVHPMEGWDGTVEGLPTEHTFRRWRHFGESGAKLIWGGEAFAVQNDGRANPHQLGVIDDDVERAERGVRGLLDALREAHRAKFGGVDDLLVGLQLTHSGRFCKPWDKKKFSPRIAYHHPLLDRKVGIAAGDDSALLSDGEIERIVENNVRAAKIAQRAGFDFVDVKQCHGYLGHEFLSAFTREGRYGGDLAGRTRFAREIIEGIRSECPGLMIGARISVFDQPAFKPDALKNGGGKMGPGVVEDFGGMLPYRYGFGCDENNPVEMDLREPIAYINQLAEMGVTLINASCGSPYYNPHLIRPAAFPPSDGYGPPEDPLVGVARQIGAVRRLKEACAKSIFVGSGYTYLQEYLPHVAQGVVREGWTDFVGVGRMVLSYWEMPGDTLAGAAVRSKRICRTFSDCTTAPRSGMISGCYPLDSYYKDAPEFIELKLAKSEIRRRLG